MKHHMSERYMTVERWRNSEVRRKSGLVDIFALHIICDPLFLSGDRGLTLSELLSKVKGYSPERLQAELDVLERAKFVYHVVEDRGKVYRPLVFETVEDLAKAKAGEKS